ncbi:MAG: hypothetical protein RIG61_04565 [Deltaproteobacteria bacterium]
MNRKKTNIEKTKQKAARKSISTFSKLNEHLDNELIELARSVAISNEIGTLIKERTNAFRLLANLSNQSINVPLKIIQEHTNQLFDSIKLMAQQSNASALAALTPTFDALTLLHSSIAIKTEIFQSIEGAFINLPIDEIQRSLSKIKSVDIDITEFKPYKVPNHEYLLRTTTTETTDLGIIKLRTIQQTQMQVQSLQGDVKKMKQFVLEDGKKKDEMLEELLDYFRDGGTSTVKVQKIKYNKKTAELIINDNTIGIKTDTNQHYLCKILFASKKSIQRVWEIYDIVEALGENADSLDGWVKVIYSTVRHLNEKIQFQTGIERFILYDNKTVMVNPKYLDFT